MRRSVAPCCRMVLLLIPLVLHVPFAAAELCTGDCDANGGVSVDEVIRGIDIALGVHSLDDCWVFDRDGTGRVEIDELVAAVDFAVHGCSTTLTPTSATEPELTTTPTQPLLPASPTATPTTTPTLQAAPSGLTLINREDVPNDRYGTPHVFDLVVGDRLYVADSCGGALAYSVGDAGLSFVLFSDSLREQQIRCTSLAFHAASHRLYCASVESPTVVVLDADTGALTGAAVSLPGIAHGYRDLHVVDDTLYLAGFEAGLLRAPIQADGSLGDIETYLDGEVVGVDGDATRLVFLDRASGLRILEHGQEVAPIALDGPPMRLTVHDGVATVALGSRGVVVIDLENRTTVVAAHPACVAVDADYHQGALAVACTSGLYLFQTQPALRAAGWVAADYASLNVRFMGDILVAADWRTIAAYRTNLAGRALGLDAPRGFLLERGQGIRFAVRNPDDQPQHLDGQTIPPRGELTIEVPPGNTDEIVDLVTEERRPLAPTRVYIARGKPLVSFAGTFPIPIMSRYVSFILPFCALQYPALEDLSWLTAHGEPPDGLEPLILLTGDNDTDPWLVGDFLRLWGEPLEAKHLVEVLPIASNSAEVFDASFAYWKYLGGADVTAELAVDAEGQIVGFARVYRGAYPLAAKIL